MTHLDHTRRPSEGPSDDPTDRNILILTALTLALYTVAMVVVFAVV